MFLTNTRINNNAVSADPSTGWKMLYESEVKWHEIEMAMIKCEHSAIVNENTVLYNEGVSEYKEKAKKWFAYVRNEFLRYLDKVLDTWTNVQNKIRTWVFDMDAAKRRIDKLAEDSSLTLPARHKYIIENIGTVIGGIRAFKNEVDEAVKAINASVKSGGLKASDYEFKFNSEANAKNGPFARIKDAMDKADAKGSSESEPLDKANATTLLKTAANFAKNDRVNAIKALQYARNQIVKALNAGLKAADTDAEDLSVLRKGINALRRDINEFISMVNKATNACMSLINKLKASGNKSQNA